MAMLLMQVITNCNVLNAMKADAVDTGVCSFYTALYSLLSCGFSGSSV